MNVKGVDTIATITPAAAETLIAEGYSFVGRYVVPETGLLKQKALTAAEAQTIHNAGLSILCIYETTADRAKQGASAGTVDGQNAKKRAQELGIPKSTVIFFAVDYNAPKSDYDAIKAYFAAVKVAAAPYQTGVYGSRNVCTALDGLAGYYQCYAWSNGIAETADVIQTEYQQGDTALDMKAKLDFAVDIDIAFSTSTMWNPATQTGEKASVQWMRQMGFENQYFATEQWEKLCDIVYGFHGPSDPQWFSGKVED